MLRSSGQEGNSVSLKVRFDIKDGQPRGIELGTSCDNQSINYASQANGAHLCRIGTSQVGENRAPAFANDGDSSTRWASDYTKGNDEQGKNLDAKPKREKTTSGWISTLDKSARFPKSSLPGKPATPANICCRILGWGNIFLICTMRSLPMRARPAYRYLSFDATETQYLRMQELNVRIIRADIRSSIEAYEKVSLSASMDKAKRYWTVR